MVVEKIAPLTANVTNVMAVAMNLVVFPLSMEKHIAP